MFNRLFARPPEKLQEHPPKRVTHAECNRLNLFFTNITRGDADDIKLVEGVPYIWVFTANKEVIIGLEEPLKYPQAFMTLATDRNSFDLIRCASVQRYQSPAKLGHPTLAANFNDKGDAETAKGKAFIGGELVCNNGCWILNNLSGRYGIVRNQPEDVFPVMHEAAAQLSKLTNGKPEIMVLLPHAKYLNYYYRIWRQGESDVEHCLMLLEDYVQQMGPSLKKENELVRLVQTTLGKFRESVCDVSVQDVLQFLLLELEWHKIKLDDALMLRLKFIAGQTGCKLDLGNVSHSKTKAPVDELIPPESRESLSPKRNC